MKEKWFSLSVEQIEKKLKTNAAGGLTPKAAASRVKKKEKPFFYVKKYGVDKIIINLMSDFFLILLLLLAFLSLFFKGDRIIGIAILILCAVNLGIAFMIYYKDRRCVESLSSFFIPTARVIRGGKLYIADYSHVVPGDVIMVQKGDVIGCDARLVYSDSLTVEMRVDKKRTAILQKYANGAINPSELRAENMSNMIHAGSRVVSGSGRAIVVATGNYTYLGALIGGFAEKASVKMPKGFVNVSKSCMKIAVLLLALILPFSLFSILFGHFTGGTVMLSEVLLVALSLGATMTLFRFSNLFGGFFIHFMRKNALSDNPCIVRSVDAFDDLNKIDYLFLLDGSITCDGIKHFESLITSDGETKNLNELSVSEKILCDAIGIYHWARRSALLQGSGQEGFFDIGLEEFSKSAKIDFGVYPIRCSVQSYIHSSSTDFKDTLIYIDRSVKCEISVAFETSVIDECNLILSSGETKQFSIPEKIMLKNKFLSCFEMGKTPVIFAKRKGDDLCFVGMLVLRDGTDSSLIKAAEELYRHNVKVITFTGCPDRSKNIPEVPKQLRYGKRAYADDFKKRSVSITSDFGNIDEYCGFDSKMIAELVKYAKSKGKKVAVLGLSDYAKEAIGDSDLFLTCAPVRTSVFGRFSEEIKSLEIPGNESSASCMQYIKSEADVLLSRPKNETGGLLPFAKAVGYCKMAYRNLKNYMVYLSAMAFIRIITVIIPMLFGNSNADARQILFLGFVLDAFAMLLFMGDSRKCNSGYERVKKFFQKKDIDIIKYTVKEQISLFASLFAGSAVAVILPNIFGMVDLFGEYVYKAEYTFFALGFLQIASFTYIYIGYIGDFRNVKCLKRLVKDIYFLIMTGLFAVFAALCLLTPVGMLFGIIRIPIFYFLISLVPTVAFLLSVMVFNTAKSKDKKDKCK